jgi:hypothetical protein
MSDKALLHNLFDRPSRGSPRPTLVPKEPDAEEGSVAAFGFLRGLDARALAVEFRFRDGNRDAYSYSLLSSWRYNPSAGLLLKFTSDLVTLVLVHGSNLDAEVPDKGVNLVDRGLARHRITYIQEMREEDLRRAGQGEPTIDDIEVAECESAEQVREWLQQHAPLFLR